MSANGMLRPCSYTASGKLVGGTQTRSMIGMRIAFDQPRLPPWIEAMTLRRLAVSDNASDIRLSRSGDRVLVDVMRRDPEV
jgi:hypothetical protein